MSNLSGLLDHNPNKAAILASKILIVEDDFLSRTVIKRVFTTHGFTHVLEAQNGKEGLEKLRAEMPDLVITDMMMPVMDGFALCREARADSNRRVSDVPILVQTSLTDLGDKAPIYHAGATDYLAKPIDPRELLARSIPYLEQAVLFRKVQELLAKK